MSLWDDINLRWAERYYVTSYCYLVSWFNPYSEHVDGYSCTYAKALFVCVGCHCDRALHNRLPLFSSARKTFWLNPLQRFQLRFASYLRHQDVTGWTVVASPRIASKLPFYTSHLLPFHTIRHRRALSWGPTCFFELKMKILVPDTSTERVCLQRVLTLGLISKAEIGGCSARSRGISIGETGFPRRSFRCTVMRAWRREKQNGVSERERRTWEYTRLICGEVMSAGSIVISDFSQKGWTLISPSVHGTTQGTNISFYTMYRIVQLCSCGFDEGVKHCSISGGLWSMYIP